MRHPPPQKGSSSDQPPRAAFVSTPPLSTARQVIGAQVRAARLAAHLTQQELADQAFSKGAISAIERGTMTPSLRALAYLAQRLGVSMSSLLGEHAALLREAEKCLHQGRYAEAIALLEQSGQRCVLAGAHERYGQFLAEQGRYQDAYEQMRLAVVASRLPNAG